MTASTSHMPRSKAQWMGTACRAGLKSIQPSWCQPCWIAASGRCLDVQCCAVEKMQIASCLHWESVSIFWNRWFQVVYSSKWMILCFGTGQWCWPAAGTKAVKALRRAQHWESVIVILMQWWLPYPHTSQKRHSHSVSQTLSQCHGLATSFYNQASISKLQ